jgi:RsiW-degrading membrane proteinase PrsW (M82 family)
MNLAYALLIGVLPALLWLWFWLKEDALHPEPKSMIAGSFILGIIMVILAIFLERYVAHFIFDEKMRYIVWAAIEELSKFLAFLFIILGTKNVDEPIDVMIYCITVALGFAALENALFIFSPISDGQITQGIITGNMRFMGATLVHTVSTALIGFFIGITFYKSKIRKFFAAILGVILAVGLHASFNLSIINETVTNILKVFGWVWLSVVILIILFEEIKNIGSKEEMTM